MAEGCPSRSRGACPRAALRADPWAGPSFALQAGRGTILLSLSPLGGERVRVRGSCTAARRRGG